MPDDARTLTAEPSTALAVRHESANMLTDGAAFEHGWRVAKLFASSQLIPQHLRDKPADCFIALHMARELRENPVVVMQNIYIVSGKAGWSATYMIGRANRSGVFKGRITWKTEGAGPDMVVTARATLADTGEEVAASASMAMARAEAWTKNSKYTSMPEHMLRWRSATMLIRLYAPEVMLGIPTSDELEDMSAAGKAIDITPAVAREAADPFERAADGQVLENEPHDPDTGEIAPTESAAPAGAPSAGAEPSPAAGAADPFWQGDLSVKPAPKGNKGDFYWPGWEEQMHGRIAQAGTSMQLADLKLKNKGWLDRHRISRADKATLLAQAFEARSAAIAAPPPDDREPTSPQQGGIASVWEAWFERQLRTLPPDRIPMLLADHGPEIDALGNSGAWPKYEDIIEARKAAA